MMLPGPKSTDDQAIPIVIVGHVDHGKSTLIARLVHDAGGFTDGKVAELQAVSDRRGTDFEWSFLLDALQVERDQAITVDSTQVRFALQGRQYLIIDAPGHHEFIRNMLTGASQAVGAVLVVDATQGLAEQTKHHVMLLKFLGHKQIIVVINKMDLVGFDQAAFAALSVSVNNYCSTSGIAVAASVPVSARHGDGLFSQSDRLAWYVGPTVAESLAMFSISPAPVDRPVRFPVQDVYRHGDQRILVGRLDSGCMAIGDQVVLCPTGRTATITGFFDENGLSSRTDAKAGESVAIALDHELFVERGHVAASVAAPPSLATLLKARVVWLDAEPLKAGAEYILRVGTATHVVLVDSINRLFDFDHQVDQITDAVHQYAVAEISLRTRVPVPIDPADDGAVLSRAMLLSGHRVVGACLLQSGERRAVVSSNLTAVIQSVSRDERAARNGYRGAVIWFTGLSGAGKSTLAMALQRELFDRRVGVYVLDGDNVRHGLNHDLGFNEADRLENLRRVAEVARLFADAGLIVITAFIAPTVGIRTLAREIVGAEFHEVYVDADLATCEARDTKGLYAKARRGEIKDFTGISSVWEPPMASDLAVPTSHQSIADSLGLLVDYVERRVLGARKVYDFSHFDGIEETS
ncbi:MAG: adenylyl-sulfate kinase [Alphaproteobacteria bacterium]|nr:adenylyl-sulfate kinase [Alphaproteobacteria bacterium]